MAGQDSEPLSRAGCEWSDDETIKLLRVIQKNYTDSMISKEMGRTPGAIRKRRQFIAADYHFNNKLQIDQIIKYTGLSEKEVKDAIERRKPAEFRRLLRLKKDMEIATIASPPTSVSLPPPA